MMLGNVASRLTPLIGVVLQSLASVVDGKGLAVISGGAAAGTGATSCGDIICWSDQDLNSLKWLFYVIGGFVVFLAGGVGVVLICSKICVWLEDRQKGEQAHGALPKNHNAPYHYHHQYQHQYGCAAAGPIMMDGKRI